MDAPKIPGYEILEALPRGGMSVVFKACQLSLNRIVALKTLPSDLVRDAADIEWFLAEARITANLTHPNIVPVYDFGKTDEGVYYFAMHYVKGCSISSWIRDRGFIPERETLMVAQSIADALDYAWQEAGVIHRDIKPANVIIDDDGTVKVVDLGVAQSINHVVYNKKTEENVIAGTPEYMAPEQVRGESQLDSRVDIYALGAMMYHCLTGIKPFDGHPQEETMTLQETGFIQDPQDIRSELSVAISCLVETFMAKDRKFRHANWDEAQQDIKRVRKGQMPEWVLPPDGISTVQRSPARHRRMRKKKQVSPKPAVTQAPSPVYDLFSPIEQTITDKTAKKQMLSIKAKRVFAGLLGIVITVLIGLIILPSKNSPTNNRKGTVPDNRSSAYKPTAIPSLALYGERDMNKWANKQQAIENELKIITDKAEELANHGHLLEAVKLLSDYSGLWCDETLKEREQRASEYQNRFKLQKERESTDRLMPMLMKDIASHMLQGDIDAADDQIQDALQDPMLASRQSDLSKMADQLNQIRHVDKQNISSFEQQIGQETEAALLKGWLLWQTGNWSGAEKQWCKSNIGLSQALLDAGREQHKYEENKAIEAKLKQTESSSTPVVTVKSETDITWLRNMLLEHNPKLMPEQITAQSLDGKVVRLEIVSLYVRDISSVRKLADLEALACIAFKPNENIDSAKSAPVKDLTPLKGLQLRELNLFGTNIKDLAPLQGMPLEVLNIANTNVKDLTPLKKLPLKSLNIKQTPVRDLTPILNLPIEQIWLDFSPSKRPRETDRKFWDVLRRMHSLKFINDHAVAEFEKLGKTRKTGI